MNRRFRILLEGQAYSARVHASPESDRVDVALEGAGDAPAEPVRVLVDGANPVLLVGSRVLRWTLRAAGSERALSRFGTARTAHVGDGKAAPLAGSDAGGDGVVRAPMPGRIIAVAVAPGAQVEAGERLLVIEAMKMQNELFSPKAGRVEAVLVAAGDAVERGAELVRLE